MERGRGLGKRDRQRRRDKSKKGREEDVEGRRIGEKGGEERED